MTRAMRWECLSNTFKMRVSFFEYPGNALICDDDKDARRFMMAFGNFK